MKTKLIYAIVFFMVAILGCSKSENESDTNSTCYIYSVEIADNCECEDYTCKTISYLYEEEYNRILGIYNSSTDPCLYVTGTDLLDASFEGYLKNISKSKCPDFGW